MSCLCGCRIRIRLIGQKNLRSRPGVAPQIFYQGGQGTYNHHGHNNHGYKGTTQKVFNRKKFFEYWESQRDELREPFLRMHKTSSMNFPWIKVKRYA